MNISTVSNMISNRMLILHMKARYTHFVKSLRNLEAAQTNQLLGLLRKNHNTQIAQKYNFEDIKSVTDYQKHVPLTDYEEYAEYIDKIADGKQAVLTSDDVILFEPSSGTSSSTKLIPYTKSLKDEFLNGIHPWLYTTYQHNPELYNGKSYWSISPQVSQQKKGKVRVGFEDDSEYFGTIGRHLFRMTNIDPAVKDLHEDIDQFRTQTMLHLLSEEMLTFISVWSPTFLILLLDHFDKNALDILNKLKIFKDGRYSSRADKIWKIVKRKDKDYCFHKIWPSLSLVSCWTDGNSKCYAKALSSYLPNIKFQGKGLIATEAFISLPFWPDRAPVLSVNSHFFEFMELDTGSIKLAHQLEKGKCYSVIVTTSGGLYRYQLKDTIEVSDVINTVPTFRFVSKDNYVSDHLGEKLNELVVANCFKLIFKKFNISPDFYLLAPISYEGDKVSYCIFIESSSINHESAKKILFEFTEHLKTSFHYDYCRKLGQLDELKLFHITSKGRDSYYKRLQESGFKIGNIKPMSLDKHFGWDSVFNGKVLAVNNQKSTILK